MTRARRVVATRRATPPAATPLPVVARSPPTGSATSLGRRSVSGSRPRTSPPGGSAPVQVAAPPRGRARPVPRPPVRLVAAGRHVDASVAARRGFPPRRHPSRPRRRRRGPRASRPSRAPQSTPPRPSTAFDPQKRRISAVDKRLSVIDDVPTTFHRCERLYVSHNRLRSLASLAQFPELRLLSAADNPVDDVTQLDALAGACPHLEALSLELTPLAKLPHYRAHVLARLPNLRSLDGVAVSESEARARPGLVRRDVGSLEMLMSAAVAAAKLRRAYQLSRVHEELRAVVFASCGPVAPSSLPGRTTSPRRSTRGGSFACARRNVG